MSLPVCTTNLLHPESSCPLDLTIVDLRHAHAMDIKSLHRVPSPAPDGKLNAIESCGAFVLGAMLI